MAESAETNNPLPSAPVQLRDVFPVTLSGKLRPLTPEQLQGQGQANAQVASPTIFPGDPLSQIQLTATVVSGQEPSLFEIEVTIVGLFERTGDLPAGYTLESYLSAIALALLMPFLREYVFEMGMRLRIGPILLPIVTPSLAPPQISPSPAPPNVAPERPQGEASHPRRRPPRPSTTTP